MKNFNVIDRDFNDLIEGHELSFDEYSSLLLKQKPFLKKTVIEQRKLDFLLKKAGVNSEWLDVYFNIIDQRMKRVKVGMKLFEAGSWNDYYELTVVKINDIETGSITVIELGNPNSAQKQRYIQDLFFKDELEKI